jgi:L-ascorbate metabolism protein UlaG (beta-lactamase superfamily)
MSTAANPESADNVYLRPEVKIEPLACGWYAWTHLVPPAQLAMNIKFRFLPLMQSFMTSPAVHAAAASDPKLFAGPFVTLTSDEVPRVRQLFDETLTRCSRLITLAEDLKELDSMLQQKASGFSLNEFYEKLPQSLQGLVELTYDLNNHPTLRLIEELLYDEEISADTQEIFLGPSPDRERTFFMNTPRLPSPESMIFKMRFSDKRLDTLAATRTRPASFKSIASLFNVRDEDMDTFRHLFTSTAPQPANNREYVGTGTRVRYFGHACVLVQTADTAILLDPTFAVEHSSDGRLTFNDLPDFIDYVILTHSHQDHVCTEMLIQLRHRVGRVIIPRNNSGSIADPSLKLTLKEFGYHNVEVVDAFDTIAIPDGEIISLPFAGEHCDLNIYSKHAILLAIKGRKFMFLVDSDGRDAVLYRRLMRRISSVDALFLGMECDGAPLTWLYEALLTKPISRKNNESRRLCGANSERAWNVWQQVKAPHVFVYAMGQEPWLRHIMGLEYAADSIQLKESDKFVELCTQAGAKAERLFITREMVWS